MARKFLYLIAGLIVALLFVLLALRIWAEELTELAFVPNSPFVEQQVLSPEAWEAPSFWVSKPEMKNAPAAWLPKGVNATADKAPVSVFFIHPTSYLAREHWNAPLNDAKSREQADLYVQSMASPFNTAAEVWAPRYRQATFGAFLTDKPDADRALDLAYGDILAAFTNFLRHVPEGNAIALAGHSQGAFLLRRLLRDRIAGTALTERLIGAWVIGWPISLKHDLPKIDLPACQSGHSEEQTACVQSWLTVADPADTGMLLKSYGRRIGLDGQSVAGTPFLCTNPLTGIAVSAKSESTTDAQANLGTLLPLFAQRNGTLVPHAVPAACGTDNFLHIGPSPDLDMGPYVLPGNNYHLYDITLFWANLRADFNKRTSAWQTRQKTQAP